jgi:uncharacterized protein YndB with AHSA1/START domain
MRSASRTSNVHKASTPQSRLLEIHRDMRVSVQELFQAFKTADAIKAWWWPRNIYADHVEYDFRQGGHYFINMKGYEGGGGGMTGEFEEIVSNELIVMTDHFADKNGRAISAKEANMPGEWPQDIFITFLFERQAGNSSQLLLSQQGVPNELQEDCIKGWSESFDKLEQYLAAKH